MKSKQQKEAPKPFNVPCSEGCGRNAVGTLSLSFNRYMTFEEKNRRDHPSWEANTHFSYPLCDACLKTQVKVSIELRRDR